ncbi:MAG: non-heme iron oxygenase ferredoxin subunit [Pseudomonadota bacterium]|nr:non-heme iron oxygenase ferredoxin subunit [Pseudomonadota bacterium]
MSKVEFHPVAKIGDVSEEDVIGVFIGEEEIALYNVEGEFFATHGICTHENVGLADGFVDGDLIECPLHSACFEIKTGKAVNPPAEVDLQTYPVKVEGDTIYVGVEQRV